MKPRLRGILLLVVVLAIAYGLRSLLDRPRGVQGPDRPAPIAVSTEGDAAILAAFSDRRSGLLVESAGRVDRILPDDNEGSRHQRFILRLESDHTLLISHNIDIAKRLPLEAGDLVSFRGQYEWNDRGGVIHWTHHDPQGRHPGGWLRHEGRRYE